MKNLITTIYLIKSFIGIILLITCFVNLHSQVRLVDIAPKTGSTNITSEDSTNDQIRLVNIPQNSTIYYQIRLVDVILKDTGSKSKTSSGSEIKQANIAIKPVYPNPAIAQITIPFEVLKTSNVYLHIYNSNKMLINTIFNGDVKNKGVHEIKIDLSDKPTGIYFYSIITENQTVNGKFIKL